MNRTVNDSWLRVVGITLLSTLSILGNDISQQPLTHQSFVSFGLNVVQVVLIWHLNRAVIAHFRYTVFRQQSTTKRLIITMLACTLVNAIVFGAFSGLHYGLTHGTLANFRVDERPAYISIGSISIELTAFGIDFFHGVMNAIFYLLIYELVFYRQDSSLYQEQLAQSEREKEQLRVANLQSQLDVLKQQVNPHFLFNSLNTLSSLISEDPKQAELFVDKLSGVYRYVLRANRGEGPEQNLTTVEAELGFIDAYFHLLQTRYGTGINLTVAVDVDPRSCHLPPLTLQLLVENAVKHNIVSPKRPLHISITVDEQGRLVIQNTLQRKVTRPGDGLSNGVGLTNIVAKYQMLRLPQPSIEESPEQFTVRLPLLACSGTPVSNP